MATFSRIIWSNRHRIFNLQSLFKVNPISLTNFSRNVSTTKFLFDETPIKMPALSPTMSCGMIVKWHKKEGDKICGGDILCEVQTDKAVVAYEFDDDGILAKILVDENSSEIQVGDLIAILCDEDDDWKNVKIPDDFKTCALKAQTKEPSPLLEPSKIASKPIPKIDISTIKISPSARNLINHYGIELSTIQPTGHRKVLMKEDVLRVISENNLKPKDLSATKVPLERSEHKVDSKTSPSEAPYIDIEISNMRNTIAKSLTESKSNTPHAYMSIKCFMDELLKLRKYFKERSLSVSLYDMIVKATGITLKQVPTMNCQWDDSTESVHIVPDINISIAVATPTGLITPIIRNSNCLSLEEISSMSHELINKAKSNKLQPQEFIGGTFSISNLGMYDVDHFVGVINPPQAAILAVGTIRRKFFGNPDNYQLRNQTIMSLSYDARAIDEEMAAYFLEKLKHNLENPEILLHSDGSINRRLSCFL